MYIAYTHAKLIKTRKIVAYWWFKIQISSSTKNNNILNTIGIYNVPE